MFCKAYCVIYFIKILVPWLSPVLPILLSSKILAQEKTDENSSPLLSLLHPVVVVAACQQHFVVAFLNWFSTRFPLKSTGNNSAILEDVHG